MNKRNVIWKLSLVALAIALIITRSYMGFIINSSIKSFNNIVINATAIIILDVLLGGVIGAMLGNKGNPLIFGILSIAMLLLMILPFAHLLIPPLKDFFGVLLNSIELSSVVLGFGLISLLQSIIKNG
ncbi:MAG: hypothetical protein SCM11_17145 [Bacillota bacterium]|nr:hypothetical protein [Bacillota bacterium]